jgi:putative oligomerization/nucleic acid binding protein
VRAWSYGLALFFVALGVAFGALAYLDEVPGAAITFWIMAASFVGTGLLIALVAQGARVATDTIERSIVASAADPSALEGAIRKALALKGVTGALQDEAVDKALAATASGSSVIDLREYTQPGEPVTEEVVRRESLPAERETTPDPVEQLERLAKLRDSGVLSEGEFAMAKAKLLSDL